MRASTQVMRQQPREGGQGGLAACNEWLSTAHQSFDDELERLRRLQSQAEEERAHTIRRAEELAANVGLLVTEKDFNLDEVERLLGEQHLVENEARLRHVRDALAECVTEYGQLDEKIDEDLAVAAVDAEKLSEDAHRVDREIHALQLTIDGVETTKNNLLSSVRMLLEAAEVMMANARLGLQATEASIE
ncbi:unnamed protein product [Peniophora sp. CBMAI 1063]|nr:unnamed protein product [Peniophora sp. CBMAI 1063]